MNARRKMMTAMVGALLCALAACSSGGGSPKTGAGVPAANNPTASLTGIQLELWVSQSAAQMADQPIAAFEKATGAKINTVVVPDPYESNVPTKFATGAKPDLLFYSPSQSALSNLQYKKNLLPLNDEKWVSNLSPSVKSIGVVDGQRFGALITSPAVVGIYYNKKAFQQAGITAEPKNWAELMTAAHKIKSAGITPFYEAGADKWPLAWLTDVQLADAAKNSGLWSEINTNKAKWTQPTFVNAVKNYQTVIDDGLTNADYKTGTFVEQGPAVFSGKAAMAAQLNALLDSLLAKHTPAEIDNAMGFFPVSMNGTVASVAPDLTNGVSVVNSGNKTQEAAAKQFMAFWLGPNYADFIAATNRVSIMANVPTPKSVPQIAQKISAAIGNSTLDMYTAPLVHVDVFNYIDDLIYGKKTPAQVGEASQAQFEQGAKAQGLPGF